MLSAACGKFQTARECGIFVTATNEWKASSAKEPTLPPAVGPPTQAAREARALAQRYSQLAQKIDDLHVESSQLLVPVQRYQKLAREAASALQDVAREVEAGNAQAARQRRVAFDGIARGEPAIVADINRVCR